MQAKQPNKLPSGMLPSILRVVFLSVFLASGQLAIFAGFFSNVASAAPAQGAPQRSHQIPVKPLSHQAPGPDLGISVTAGAASYNVGNTVTYTLSVTNAVNASPILLGTPITFTDLAALGLSNVSVTSSGGWSFTTSSTTSPSLITGTYTGVYPVAAGATLPSVTVTGTANGAVLGLLANVATISVVGDLNLANNSATVDVSILNAPTPTIPVPSVTATVPVSSVTATVAVPTVTTTVTVPTLTATVPVPTITSTVAVPTVTATVPVPSVTATVTVPTVTATVPVPSVTATVAVPTLTATVPVPSVTTTVTVPTVTATIPVPSVTATSTVTVPTATVTIPVPSITATATAPYLTLGQTILGGLNYQVGQTVNYSLQASVGVNGGPETIANSITVSEVLPLGFTNITATGTNWTIALSDTTSPAVLTAVYTGSYPVAIGTALPLINISGVLTVDAIPSLTTTATISSLDNIDVLNNSATVTILVAAATSTPTATTTVTVPTLTATVAVPSVTTTSTVTVPTLTATVPVPSVTATTTVTVPTATVTVPTLTATVPVPSITATVTVPTLTATIPVPSVTATATVTVPTLTATVPVPSVTATVAPTLTATPTLPNVSISLTNQGGTTFQVGQTITYTIQVTNQLNSGNLARTSRFLPLGVRSASSAKGAQANTPILVTAVLPLGLSNITTNGTSWNITNSATTSPTVVTASYNGAYPIVPGQVLPVITITGTLTSNAGPIFTAQAALLVPGNTNTATVTSVDSVSVQAAVTPTTTVTVPTPTTTITIPTVTATVPVPSVTTTVTVPTPTTTITVPSATPVLNPDLSISANVLGSANVQVGHIVVYSLQVSDAANAGPIVEPNSINLTDILPLGLSQIQVIGTDWQVSTSSTISPAVITANYIGSFPVLPGTTLPTLIVTGVLAPTAVPSFTTTASVNVLGDTNYANNLASVTVLVSSIATPTATATAVPTATSIVTPTVTLPTITPIAGVDLGITQIVQGGLSVQVGHNAIFALQVHSAANAGIVTRPDSIIVSDILPLGLSQIQAAGSNWIINASATTSPTVITAVYNGVYPVLPGATLPPIIITGVLNVNAVPMFTSTANLSVPNDVNYLNNVAVNTIAVNSLLTPTATIPVPTATVTIPSPTATVALPSHLMMSISSQNTSNLTVGQNVNYNLVVSNLTNAGPVQVGAIIRVHDLLPFGLSNISASGTGWTITVTGTTGPAMLTATYTGTYPVLPGTALPPIVINGTVTSNAVPMITNTAAVSSTGNNNNANNTAILTLPVFLP